MTTPPQRRARILLATAVVAVLLAVPGAQVAQGAADEDRRWHPEEWRDTLSEPIYTRVVRTTSFLEASDGTQLAVTVHLPEGLPADARIPTLLQLSPYRPLDQALGGYGSFEFFVLRGAAYVQADARGTGWSAGCLDFGGSADRDDAEVFAEWIRSQPWSDGRVVTDGVSHPGMGSVVAHAAVPGLTGALAHAPVVSYYQDEWLQGAKFEDQFNGPAYQAIELAPPLPSERLTDPRGVTGQAATCTGATAVDYSGEDGTFTPLWEDRDLSRHVAEGDAPILLTHGFVDLNVHPDHSQLYWDALPDDAPKSAIFGWWYHGHPDMDGHPFEDFDDVRHRWMDRLLFDTDNGLDNEPRVLVEDDRGTWHEGHDWPLEPSEQVRLHADADGVLTAAEPAAGEVAYTDRSGAERGEWADAHVAFRTAPLAEDRLVNGAPVVHLAASSTATTTKWVAYLLREAPDGSRERISHGYADSRTWAGEDQWRDMAPGDVHRWELRLQPTAVVVPAGHRLVLLLASADSRNTAGQRSGEHCFADYRGGCYRPSGILPARSTGTAVNTVVTGADATSVELWWVDPADTAKPPF